MKKIIPLLIILLLSITTLYSQTCTFYSGSPECLNMSSGGIGADSVCHIPIQRFQLAWDIDSCGRIFIDINSDSALYYNNCLQTVRVISMKDSIKYYVTPTMLNDSTAALRTYISSIDTGVPNLQQVTTIGNTTNNSILLDYGGLPSNSFRVRSNGTGAGVIIQGNNVEVTNGTLFNTQMSPNDFLYNIGTSSLTLTTDPAPGHTNTQIYQDTSGVIALTFQIADSIALHDSIPSLQEVTQVGNNTTSGIKVYNILEPFNSAYIIDGEIATVSSANDTSSISLITDSTGSKNVIEFEQGIGNYMDVLTLNPTGHQKQIFQNRIGFIADWDQLIDSTQAVRNALVDTALAIRSSTSGGTVTSVATGYGTTGGTITTTGTIKVDTTLIPAFTDTSKVNGIATKTQLNTAIAGITRYGAQEPIKVNAVAGTYYFDSTYSNTFLVKQNFQISNITTTVTPCVSTINATVATSSVPDQYSPALTWQSSGWTGSVGNTNIVRAYLKGKDVNSGGLGIFTMDYSDDGGSTYANMLTYSRQNSMLIVGSGGGGIDAVNLISQSNTLVLNGSIGGSGGPVSGTVLKIAATATNTQTSGTWYNTLINPIYNQSSGTSSNIDFVVARTQTAVGSGVQRLASFGTLSGSTYTEKFSVDPTGNGVFTGNVTCTTPATTVNTSPVVNNSGSLQAITNGVIGFKVLTGSVSGNPSISIPAGMEIESIVIIPTSAESAIKAGTSSGASDLITSTAIPTTGTSFAFGTKYFISAGSIFFSGAASTVNYIIYYH